MRIAPAALACAAALVLAGCAGSKPYPDGLAAKNFSIRTASSARAALGVHSVDAQCRAEYLGTVALDRSWAEIGIPTERWSYLVFDFASKGWFTKQTRTTLETLLMARAGYRYEANVTYRDDIYNVVIREQSPRGAWREVKLLDLPACKK